jgi:tetratricopeptide (TPR) repeat protein
MYQKTLFIILFIPFALAVKAQNIFDLSHTRQYAEYLYNSGQFNLASEEYERFLFLAPYNDTAAKKLITCYAKSGNYETGLTRAGQLFGDYSHMPSRVSFEYGTMLLHLHRLNETRDLLEQSSALIPADRFTLNVTRQMYLGEWQQTYHLLLDLPDPDVPLYSKYALIANDAINFRPRSPALSVTFSTLIPGSGTAWSGRWKDGLVTLLAVAVTGWQAWRGFDKYGKNSLYGWVYSGACAGIYIENLFHSAKSAKQFNSMHQQKFKQRAEEAFNQYY